MVDKKTGAPQDEKQAAQPTIQVVAQYVKDFSFENPNSPESLLAGLGAPETSVQINLKHHQLREGAYEAVLNFKIEAKFKEKAKVAFIIELAYAATVAISGFPKEQHQPILMVEIPKLLFPFAREIIAKATMQGGYPPLYLQPVNFDAIYVQETQRAQAAAAAEEGHPAKAAGGKGGKKSN